MRTRAERIAAEAAQWVARLDADPGAREACDAWLAEDPRHVVAWLQADAAWTRLRRLGELPTPETAPLGQAAAPTLPANPPRARSNRAWRYAAAATFLIAALGLGWTLARDRAVAYETPVGNFQRIALLDGSTVELNTNTRVTVRLTDRARELHLLRGEATFTVAHDTSRPFTVVAGSTEVQAVGTAFNVRIAGQSTRVVVTEGIVGLRPASPERSPTISTERPVLVASGRAAVIQDRRINVQELGAQEAERLLAWHDGRIAFTSAPLSEVAAEFNRYNDRKLLIEDPAVAALSVGGYFRANDLDAFLAAIGRTLPVTVIARGRDFVISRRQMTTSAPAAGASMGIS